MEYIQSQWISKEVHVCWAYTAIYPNLRVNSSQRNESFNHLIKATLNLKLSLEEALRCDSEETTAAIRLLTERKD